MRPRLTDAIWCHAVSLGGAEVAHLIHGVGASTNPCVLERGLVAYSGLGETLEERIRVIGPGEVAASRFPKGTHEFLVLPAPGSSLPGPGPISATALVPLWKLFLALRLGLPQHDAVARVDELTREAQKPVDASTLPGKAASELGTQSASPLTTEELAARLAVSKAHLCRTFKSSFGVTISHFRRALRLDRACALAWTTMRTMGDIAASAGFTDQSHMTRELIRLLGYAPLNFRQLAPCAGNPRIHQFLTRAGKRA